MTTSAEPLLLDTNVLLDATNSRRKLHRKARNLLKRAPNLVISAQIVREYIAVATRPTDVNGLGMQLEDALVNIGQFRKVVRLLPEEKPVMPRFLALLERTACRGKTVHDAFLVATMQAHGVRQIATSNPGHFERYADVVQVVSI